MERHDGEAVKFWALVWVILVATLTLDELRSHILLAVFPKLFESVSSSMLRPSVVHASMSLYVFASPYT